MRALTAAHLKRIPPRDHAPWLRSHLRRHQDAFAALDGGSADPIARGLSRPRCAGAKPITPVAPGS